MKQIMKIITKLKIKVTLIWMRIYKQARMFNKI